MPGNEINSSPVKKNSPFMETVQDKLKDVKNFSQWSAKEQMVAVGAVGMIFGALLPVVAVALPVAATGAIVALTLFFAVKAVEYTFKGLKWSAEKTVDGAKYTAEKVKDASTYTAGKIKDGAVRAKDKVREAASSLKQAAREGTSSALKKMGNGVQKLGRKVSNSGASISNFEDIPYSIEQQEPQGVLLAKRELDPDLISSNRDLKRDSLQSSSLPRSSSMGSVRTDSTTVSDSDNFATIGERPGVARRSSTSNLTRVETPEVPTRSASLTNLNRQSSFSEDVPNNPTIADIFSRQNSGTLTRSSSANGLASNCSFKSAVSNHNGSDSGFNSPTSSPTRTMLSDEGGKVKTQADLNKTGLLMDGEFSKLPSTKLDDKTDVQQQAAQTPVKAN